MSNLFPHVEEHRIYPSTFLVGVEWRVHFQLKDFKGAFPYFRTFVESAFGLQLEKPNFDAMSIHPLRLRRGEEASVKMTPHFAEFSFWGDGYHSYADSVRELLAAFIDMIQECGGEVKHICCNKKSFIGLKRDEPAEEKELLSLVFDSNLLNAGAAVLKKGNLEEENEESMNFIELDDNSGFPVKALFGTLAMDLPDHGDSVAAEVEDSTENRKFEYGVIMESQCDKFFLNGERMRMNVPDKINSELFDFFHWAYNDRVLESLNDSPAEEV